MTQEQLDAIKARPGLYLLQQAPGVNVPLYVDEDGIVWSLKIDAPLSDEGWDKSKTHPLKGPIKL